MGLVERLGLGTLKNLYEQMDTADIMEWAAYDLIKDPESRERLTKDSQNALEYEAAQMRLFLTRLHA